MTSIAAGRLLRRPTLALLCLASLAVLTAVPAAAQDVLEAGRRNGVREPEQIKRILREQPGAFEFQRAWRHRVRAIRERRVALERRRGGPMLSVSEIQAAGAAVTGTMRVPVIAGLYSDATAPYPTAAYQERLFGAGASGYSAKTFYQEMSRGAFTMDGTVTPWVTLPQPASFYEPAGGSDRFGKTGEFLRDALNGADATVNFGDFDNDGPDGVPNSGDDDGFVDAAAFIYPRHGMSCGGPGIWPHRWVYSAHWGAPYTTNDARTGGGSIKVDDYLIQGGVECNGTALMAIGTFSHEMGHALGIPDLYDTAGESEGLGEWDLMASGSYRRSHSPAHMGAWTKDFLGWVSVQTLTTSVNDVTLDPVYQAGRVLRYNIPGTDEYFLLEHREPTGSDAFILASGLLIYHVDQDVIDENMNSNTVNAGPIHGVALEEADGLDHLAAGANRGDAGDPFPGLANKTAFGNATYPNSRANNGDASGFDLSGLTYGAGVLTFDLKLGFSTAPVATVEVSPAAAQIIVGRTRQLRATLKDAAGEVTSPRTIVWTSSNPAIATVSATGLVTAVSVGGPVTITATAEGKTGSAQMTVTPFVEPGTLITSGVPVPNLGGTVGSKTYFRIVVPSGATRLRVASTGGTGDMDLFIDPKAPDLWSSTVACASTSPTTVETCTIESPAAGTWYILLDGYSDYSGLTLTATVTGGVVTVDHVTITPAAATMGLGGTRQLQAAVFDAANNALSGRTVTWASADSTIARVSITGLVTAVAAGGPVAITATSEGKSGTAQITVSATPLVAGDPSGDGAITAQDALGVLSHAVGRTLPDGWNIAVGGDANCDGSVTAVDALIILSRVVGKDVSQFCIGSNR